MNDSKVVVVCPKCGSENIKLLKVTEQVVIDAGILNSIVVSQRHFLFECNNCNLKFNECHLVEMACGSRPHK
jgi:predicted nucleic-acid-binding Zn-ribbon protein